MPEQIPGHDQWKLKALYDEAEAEWERQRDDDGDRADEAYEREGDR